MEAILDNHWQEPLVCPMLAVDDVHVWIADLDNWSGHNKYYYEVLNDGERSRARRFLRPYDHKHFVAAHGILRTLLGLYLRLDPRTVRFVVGTFGKPALDPDIHDVPLRFNISHSKGYALFAFTHRREVGIDIEHTRSIDNMEHIAQRFFSAREAATMLALPVHERERAFYACWTRKEAFIKANGRGLTQTLSSFDVEVAPDKPAALLAIEGAPNEAARWSLRSLQTVPDFHATVAVEGNGWTLSCWRFAYRDGIATASDDV